MSKSWEETWTAEDPLGCFDGGSELYEEEFQTKEEAQAFLDAKRRETGAPWAFAIEERAGVTHD